MQTHLLQNPSLDDGDQPTELQPLAFAAPLIPYKIFISAENSNPVIGEGKSIIAFSREGGELFCIWNTVYKLSAPLYHRPYLEPAHLHQCCSSCQFLF